MKIRDVLDALQRIKRQTKDICTKEVTYGYKTFKKLGDEVNEAPRGAVSRDEKAAARLRTIRPEAAEGVRWPDAAARVGSPSSGIAKMAREPLDLEKLDLQKLDPAELDKLTKDAWERGSPEWVDLQKEVARRAMEKQRARELIEDKLNDDGLPYVP